MFIGYTVGLFTTIINSAAHIEYTQTGQFQNHYDARLPAGISHDQEPA
jgi:pyruvate/2-oxoglutarate/acetoin dehydrogenase E1 component